ncbi:MAG: hypothetical protein SFU91_04770 [Chloroherpetonaceae bacterium]|nr:hypothetical protein [Chloroherpetonaceae bacterium]
MPLLRIPFPSDLAKRLLFLIIILLFAGQNFLFGQVSNSIPENVPEVTHFTTRRLESQSSGMKVLAGWAAVSIASGVALSLNSSSKAKYAGYQAVGWGAVNAAIAGFALYGIGQDFAGLDSISNSSSALLSELNEEHSFSKVLLVNLGLDVGYMGVGITLMALSRNRKNEDALFGSGIGVLIQGAFLLGFDLWQFLLSTSRHAPLEDALRTRLVFTPSPIHDLGVLISFSF